MNDDPIRRPVKKSRFALKKPDEETSGVKYQPGDTKTNQVSTETSINDGRPYASSLGTLTVLASEDSALIGRRFAIHDALIKLGRSPESDIVFPKDLFVSREHAVIYVTKGQLYLRNAGIMDESGKYQPPTNGTALNGTQLGMDSVPLSDEDVIQLGKILRLQFTKPSKPRRGKRTLDKDDDETTGGERLLSNPASTLASSPGSKKKKKKN